MQKGYCDNYELVVWITCFCCHIHQWEMHYYKMFLTEAKDSRTFGEVNLIFLFLWVLDLFYVAITNRNDFK